MDARKKRIRTLLNFFPVIGEDDNGEMIELDAERVLSIPRKIRSVEVVRRGFMSDFLFQNISNIFHAPQEVIDIVAKFEPYKAPDKPMGVKAGETAEELSVNEDGEVEIPEEQIIGTAADVFGSKVYGSVEEDLGAVIESIQVAKAEPDEEDAALDRLRAEFSATLAAPLVEAAKENYGDELKASQQKKVERRIQADVDIKLNREFGDYKIQRNIIEKEREKELDLAQTQEEADEINERHNARLEDARDELVEHLQVSREGLVKSAGETIVREVETAKKEAKKQDVESTVRDHLRGFSRTIPSFLMAYGDDGTTLANFDEIIPEDVFYEVTSISADQFRFLRDGGDYVSEETGELEHFEGNLFDPVVFDDSVREFIRLRGELANYFDESLEEDIFDYVPPQKTNQIFTPRRVVQQMVDLFEKENPGCFDDPSHTFADLYMKSGLYITEIIKRLYNSDAMKAAFPDDDARRKHILENQVFGIAPTEIIYQIATHYILGYNNEVGAGCDTNFVCVDSAELAKEGKLAEYVQRVFGGKLEESGDVETVAEAHESGDDRCEAVLDTPANRDGDWILAAIEAEGLEYADKRGSGGALWVIGDKSIQGFMRKLESQGARFTYSASGGKASKKRPAWFIPASAAERALSQD